MKSQRSGVWGGALAALILMAAPAWAATRIWTNTTGGVFSDPAMWNGGVPGANDTALFTRSGDYTVSFSSSASTTNAVFTSNTSGRVTLQLGANTWTLTSLENDNSGMIIGKTAGSTSSVLLASGTLTTPGVIVGNTNGTDCTLAGPMGHCNPSR